MRAQVQRTASERRRARRKVNQRFLSAMLDMGIPPEKAELALSETGNVGVEVFILHISACACRGLLLCSAPMLSFSSNHLDNFVAAVLKSFSAVIYCEYAC